MKVWTGSYFYVMNGTAGWLDCYILRIPWTFHSLVDWFIDAGDRMSNMSQLMIEFQAGKNLFHVPAVNSSFKHYQRPIEEEKENEHWDAGTWIRSS